MTTLVTRKYNSGLLKIVTRLKAQMGRGSYMVIIMLHVSSSLMLWLKGSTPKDLYCFNKGWKGVRIDDGYVQSSCYLQQRTESYTIHFILAPSFTAIMISIFMEGFGPLWDRGIDENKSIVGAFSSTKQATLKAREINMLIEERKTMKDSIKTSINKLRQHKLNVYRIKFIEVTEYTINLVVLICATYAIHRNFGPEMPDFSPTYMCKVRLPTLTYSYMTQNCYSAGASFNLAIYIISLGSSIAGGLIFLIFIIHRCANLNLRTENGVRESVQVYVNRLYITTHHKEMSDIGHMVRIDFENKLVDFIKDVRVEHKLSTLRSNQS